MVWNVRNQESSKKGEELMDTILVTGGAGYIGSVLVGMLVNKGYRVRVFDKLYFGDRGLRDVKSKIDLVKGDVRQFPDTALDGVKSVIHFGSLSNDPTADFDPKANKEINYEGTMRVGEACIRRGVKKMTFASSAAVLGFNVDEVANEDTKPNPQSEYAQSKLDAENGLLSLYNLNFDPVIFRQATVGGLSKRMRWDLVVNAMPKDAFMTGIIHIYCSGKNWRPLIDVNDVALAHIKAIESPSHLVGGQIFNLVEGNYTIKDIGLRICETVKNLTGKDIKVIIHGGKESRSYRIKNDKAKSIAKIIPDRIPEETSMDIVNALDSGKYTDIDNPIYYNISWMKKLVAEGGEI